MSDDTIAAPAALADDLLIGAEAIAKFLGAPRRKIFYLAERQLIPCGKQGATIVASRRTLEAHYARLTGASGK